MAEDEGNSSSVLGMQTDKISDTPTQSLGRENDSGFRDLDSKTDSSGDSDDKNSTTTVGSATKDSTGEDDKGINEQVLFSPVEEQKIKETELLHTTTSPGEAGEEAEIRRGSPSVSRRARRNGAGRNSRGGTRRGGMGYRLPNNYWNSYSEQGAAGPSDFRTPIFSSLQGNYDRIFNQPFTAGNLPEHVRSGNEDLPAAPGFLSRDLMIQLMRNINSGFLYINQSFQLLKQSQLELFQAKHTLERVYKSQHGDFTEVYYEDFGGSKEEKTEENEDELSDSRSQISTEEGKSEKPSSPPVPERFQIHLNPFQFVEGSDEMVSASPGTSEVTEGRRIERGKGRGGRGHGMRSQRRKRQQSEQTEYSAYCSERARKGVRNLVEHLNLNNPVPAELVNDDDRNNSQPIVELHDVKTTLQTKKEIKPNVYSAAEIQKTMKRREKRDIEGMNKDKSRKSTSSELEEEEPMEVEESEEETALKKVSTIQKTISPAKEENADRKDPVTVPTQNSMSEAKTKRNNLPQWRQMRVDPEIMARIKLRVEELLCRPADGKESELPAAPSSTHSLPDSEEAVSSKHSSLSDKDAMTHDNANVSAVPNSNREILTKKSKSKQLLRDDDSSSSICTPPDEVMLDLTPEKDNCACHSKDDNKQSMKKSTIVADSKDVHEQEENIENTKINEKKILSKNNSNSSVVTEIVCETIRDNEELPVETNVDDFDDTDGDDLFTPIRKPKRKKHKKQKRDK